jgi:hypothetical protein
MYRAELHSSKLQVTSPRAFDTHCAHNTYFAAEMDTDMMDAGYDIDIDVGAGSGVPAQQPQQVIEVIRAQGYSLV